LFRRGHNARVKGRPRLPVEERFWKKVAKSEDGCWLWIARGKTAFGYGLFKDRFETHTMPAHRWSWMLTYGEIPPGAWVLHKCDTPACVRPDHLYIGGLAENTRDAIVRNRYKSYPGQSHPNAKFTDDDVRAIRARFAAGETNRQIAADYAVTYQAVAHVTSGRAWRHLD
jgi:hypothetical protein